jgi:hypothetical protein
MTCMAVTTTVRLTNAAWRTLRTNPILRQHSAA